MRVKTMILSALCTALLMLSCGYGKDTGPKQPKVSPHFAPLADRFQARCKTCFEDVFHVNMGRQLTAAERTDAVKMKKAMASFRLELMQCMTGKGYGNETQVEPSITHETKYGAGPIPAQALRHGVGVPSTDQQEIEPVKTAGRQI